MNFTFMKLLSLLPFALHILAKPVLGGKFKEFGLRPERPHRPRNSTYGGQVYKMKDFYQGQSFLDEWDFFTDGDPSHGNVKFQARDDAIKKKLAFVQQDATIILAVDDFSDVPVGGKRDSIRISTKKTYNHGLFIADIASMPHGCSTWPAYWSVGPNWPMAGEIDILEGVHEGPTNKYVLHTSGNCEIKDTFSNQEATAILFRSICSSSYQDNRGCGFSDHDPNSYGRKFNFLTGGVFAHLWDSSGIKIWRFPRYAIPDDIQTRNPNPSSWGTPTALFPLTNCDMSSQFYDHTLVLDTTICGDFASATYTNAGCPGTCAEAVANATNYKFAKWKINYIAVYVTDS